MSQYVKKYYNQPAEPKNMLIFLHGYNGETADLEQTFAFLKNHLPKTLIVTPESLEPCEKNSHKKQWYSLRRHDPNDQRRNPETSMQDLEKIYAEYGEDIRPIAQELNLLIDTLQKQNGLTNKQTVIAGFSQGAMLACYTALSRRNFDGLCLMFSGVVAGAPTLAEDLSSKPKIVLFHGTEDINVNFKTMEFSRKWLTDAGLEVVARPYENLTHKIREDELSDAVTLIKS